jgi:glycosyltransferase involved in cell wall biosynthesis
MKPLVYSVLPRPPHPTRDGLAIRNYHLLAALSARFRVRAFSLSPPAGVGPGRYPEGVEFEEIPRAGEWIGRASALVGSVVSGEAFPVLLYRSPRLSARLAREAARERPAWIVAHSYHVAEAALEADAPVWVDFHNIDSEIWRRLGKVRAGPAAAVLRWQAPKVARAERAIARCSRRVSCVSGRDARSLSAAGAKDPFVLPNGVDLERYADRGEPSSEQRVLFVGDLSWPPNADGVAWFCEEIWPLVARLAPSARFEVLGRGASGRLARLRRSPPVRVAFLGEGDDTRPHWGRAAVAVVPLQAGGGTRLKILEAAACGVPVVSTRIGAEGLDFEEGPEIAIADLAEEFASAVSKLLADAPLARVQAAAARRRVEACYDWRRIGPLLAAELLRGIGAK